MVNNLINYFHSVHWYYVQFDVLTIFLQHFYQMHWINLIFLLVIFWMNYSIHPVHTIKIMSKRIVSKKIRNKTTSTMFSHIVPICWALMFAFRMMSACNFIWFLGIPTDSFNKIIVPNLRITVRNRIDDVKNMSVHTAHTADRMIHDECGKMRLGKFDCVSTNCWCLLICEYVCVVYVFHAPLPFLCVRTVLYTNRVANKPIHYPRPWRTAMFFDKWKYDIIQVY